MRGALQGVGFLVGTFAAVLLFGWLLSVLGVIPGLDVVVEYLHSVSSRTLGL